MKAQMVNINPQMPGSGQMMANIPHRRQMDDVIIGPTTGIGSDDQAEEKWPVGSLSSRYNLPLTADQPDHRWFFIFSLINCPALTKLSPKGSDVE